MIPNIIHREVITLPEKQLQMLRSGWGAPAIDDTITEAIIYISDGHEVHGYISYPKAFVDVMRANKTTEHTIKSNKTTERTETTEEAISDELLEMSDESSGGITNASTSLKTNPSVSSVGSVFVNDPNTTHNPLPCIIWNRGGSKERGAIDRFTAVGMFGQLASWGFVVFASMYRATFNREMEDDFGGDEVRDILNLMDLAQHIPFADTSRWAMEGWSRGGMMTYLALRERHDIKAAITLGGITDVAECCETVPRIQATLQHLIEREGPEVLHTRSAIHFAGELPRECKYLIIHGTKDDVVSPRQATKLADKFLDLGLHFRLVLMEESDHYLKAKRKEVDALRKEWLGKVTE